jgi:hypothetical protein
MAVEGGFGYTVKITVDSVLTAIAHITDGDVPELEKVLKESTGHDSSGGWAEYTPSGKKKAAAFTLTLGWDPASTTHAALLAAFGSDTPVNFEITDPQGEESIAFAGHVQKMGRTYDQEGMRSCKVTIQPTGAITVS